MERDQELIHQSIIRDMSEGVMTIRFDGKIHSLNPAAARILERKPEALIGQPFARCFFEYSENDAFNQTVLDAVYDTAVTHERVVPFFTGSATKQLDVTTSFLHDGETKIGVIAVLRDISELVELRDAVLAMERIRLLNEQLAMRNALISETFGRFLSDEIVKQLLDTPDGLALGGRKRTLTVLMSDLRGFTALSERMEAQSLISMLNHYLGEMTESIQRRGGTIIEFIGDGIMAVFGAPAQSDTHAADAIAAAVDMQARMEQVNEWNLARGYPALEMGIGVNTGEVIVGNIGSEKRTKYGVVGSHVNLCGRIESYTVGGQVLIAPQTRAMASTPLEITRELEIYPKGTAAPLIISDVTGIGGAYDVRCIQRDEPPRPLKAATEIVFLPIRDKHCTPEASVGLLTALSRTGALLKTDAALQPFDNLQLEADGKLFCKVLSVEENGYLLRFTALPAGFEAWYHAHGA